MLPETRIQEARALQASNEVIEERLMALAGQLAATECELLKLLDEFDQQGGWHGEGIRSFSHWLNWKLGMGNVIAREKVRVARALRDLPLIGEAFSRGVVSYSKVRAMTRVATPANESFLLQIAEYGTATHLEQLCRHYKRLSADEGLEPGSQRDRFVTWFTANEQMTEFRIRLPHEDAEVVIAAILKTADALYSSRETVTEENVSAETSGETPDVLPDAMARRAEALTCLAERALSVEPGENAPIRDVVVHLNANPGHPAYQVAGGACAYRDSSDPIAANVARRLTCDCRTTPVYQDDRGNVLNIGRRSRVVSPAMRLALKVRDGGCRFPGCHHTRWTDAHHVKHWIDGGETSLDNLITLCRYHHTRLHQGEYRIDIANGEFRFYTRSDQPIPDVLPARTLRIEPVNSEPMKAGWQGDSMDMDLAIGVMFDREGDS